MTEFARDDALWNTALDWVMREHEEPLDDKTHTALCCWLAEAPEHRQAYEQARTVWLMTGLVPTVDEQTETSSGDD